MFKCVLVAVDGSSPSIAGLKSATRLAKDQKARLVVLHVVDDGMAAVNYEGVYVPAGYVDSYIRAIQESGEKVLDKAVSSARKSGIDVDPAMVHARNRTVARAILDQAKKSSADVIVLGTHGRRGFQRVLMGSDAEAVVREASVPVLLVRGAGTHQRSKPKAKSTVTGARRRSTTAAAAGSGDTGCARGARSRQRSQAQRGIALTERAI